MVNESGLKELAHEVARDTGISFKSAYELVAYSRQCPEIGSIEQVKKLAKKIIRISDSVNSARRV